MSTNLSRLTLIGTVFLILASSLPSLANEDEPSEHKSGSKIIRMFPGVNQAVKKWTPLMIKKLKNSKDHESSSSTETSSESSFLDSFIKKTSIFLLLLGILWKLLPWLQPKSEKNKLHRKSDLKAKTELKPEPTRLWKNSANFQTKPQSKSQEQSRKDQQTHQHQKNHDKTQHNRKDQKNQKEKSHSHRKHRAQELTIEEAFQLLGLKTQATPTEITRAYRKLIVKNHPDKFHNASPETLRQAEKFTKKLILAKSICLNFAQK